MPQKLLAFHPNCYSRLHQKKKLRSYTSVELYTDCISVFAVPIPVVSQKMRSIFTILVYLLFWVAVIHAAPFRANPNSSKSDIIPRSSLPSNKAYQQRPQPASEVVEGPGIPPPLVRLEHHTITVTRIKATMTSGQPPKPCHEVPSKDGERLKKRLKSYFETVWKFRKDSVDIKFDENIIEYDLGDVEADFVFEYRFDRSGSRPTTGFVASSRRPSLAAPQSPPPDGEFVEVFSGTSSVNSDGFVTRA
ncbi:hypothetical protein DFJ43DRAFT_1169173 [Lentinula guzmanii]|uniref:Uncharacterized protein n=1 Tax=Lentinula guzmanii TaxID=2804957 RepID=A0AA38JCJ7_9AGAR|nr:hypothetical protein DFJ43DRAFT_1169173 [Lentinula guzmanii]